ncbi:BTAD domain-containing putative transcriptional regulator [Streptomyces sp. NPDC002886]|uniref:AfsR/SARP family transcriptional regulator n=1 Tax=Streptomyces sp. NPDC002886 TaxID=3364667 RepID=UPI0036AE1075
MRFTVLGQVGAQGVDGVIEVQRPQRRAVLAYLLLNAGQPVTLERLIDAVWADEAPSSARTQVHSAVSSLRQTLRGTDLADRIQTTADGYICAVDDTELDLLDFRARVRRAAEEMTGREEEQASETLREALAMWRGAPLAGVSAAFVEPARARLNEERLDACQQLAACELGLGREAELVPTLTELVEANPQREQLVGQLLIALYRTGRQAEATQRFADTRRFLAEELGLDPGPELSAIHAAILRADPGLATAALSSRTPRTSPAVEAAPASEETPARLRRGEHPADDDLPVVSSEGPAAATGVRGPWGRRIRLGLGAAAVVAGVAAAIGFVLHDSGAPRTGAAAPGATGRGPSASLSGPPSGQARPAPTGPAGKLEPIRVFNIDGDCKTQTERLPACRLSLARNPYVTYDLNNVVSHRVWHGDVLMADCMVVNGIRIEDEHGVGTPNWFRVHLTDIPEATAWLPAVRTHDDPGLPVCAAA